MVMKKVRLARQSEAQRKASYNEMQLVPTLRHPFVVTCHDAWVERGHTICIVYGYCESGDLASYLHQRAKVRLLRWGGRNPVGFLGACNPPTDGGWPPSGKNVV
jgi:serine/threonine protein kinase